MKGFANRQKTFVRPRDEKMKDQMIVKKVVDPKMRITVRRKKRHP